MKINFNTHKQQFPEQDKGFEVKYGVSKRTGYTARWYFIVLIIISPIIGFVWYGASTIFLVTAKGILTTEPLEVKASSDGFMGDIYSKVGDQLAAGELMFEMHSPVLEQQAQDIRRTIDHLEAEQARNKEQYIALSRSRVRSAKHNLNTQASFYEKYKEFEQQGIIPLSQQVQLQQAKADAELLLLSAEQDYINDKLQFLVGQTEKSIFQLKQKLSEIETKIELLKFKSPHNTTLNEIFVRKGEYISQGEVLASISSRETPVVIAYINPQDMNYSFLNQTATVKLPNGISYQARIEEPTQLAHKIPPILASPFDGTKPALKVILTLQNKLDRMLEGLPIDVRFHYY